MSTKSKSKITTLGELVEAYLKHLSKSRSAGTVFSYSIEARAACRWFGEDTKLEAVTPERVAAYFESDAVTKTRTGKPKAKVTVDKTRRILRLALAWGEELGGLASAGGHNRASHNRQ